MEGEEGGSPAPPSVDLDALPKAVIKRIVKAALSRAQGEPHAQGEASGGGGRRREWQLNKDALLGLQQSAVAFIAYLSGVATDRAAEAGRATVSAEDCVRAVEELGFGEFAAPMREALAVHKRSDKPPSSSRKKSQAPQAARDGDNDDISM